MGENTGTYIDRNRNRIDPALAVIGEKYILDIIYFMKYKSPCLRNDIYMNVSRNKGMPEKIQMLIDIGLIEERACVNSPYTSICLTEKGMKAADTIESILSLIKTDEDTNRVLEE